MANRNFGCKRAFTLIELLIVVAIIAILAAIAVPNFLEAQTRAKISRAKADIRSMATAVETYRIDYNKYIGATTNSDMIQRANAAGEAETAPAYSALRLLSTPIAYMSSIPNEAPFKAYQGFGTPLEKGYQYSGGKTWEFQRTSFIPNFFPVAYQNVPYYFNCVGPSKVYTAYRNQNLFAPRPWLVPYEPTNGTVSLGDILYPGGGGWTSFM